MRLIALLFLLVSPALTALAAEIPGRVGRVAFTEGTVAVYQDPDAGWEKAFVNTPLTSRNSVWTDPRSRADLRAGGIAIRMEEATQFDLAELDDDDLQAYLGRGSVAIRVRHYNNSHRLDFATPHARFRLYGTGRYRLDVDPESDETMLTVFAGSASMRSSAGDVTVQAGSAVRIFGTESPTFARETARPNRLDRWAQARDERWVETRTMQYVSHEMTGYEDLDRYGQWIEEPGYGALWYPTRVEADWVPYRYGRWSYVRPWGWTWVDDQPWGYAPFHYGRWVRARDRWCWYPGQRVERPTWAPALVAFVGGANFSVAVRSGGGTTPAVGWYPLAPTERYEPWYQTSPTYVSRVNNIVVNNITVNNTYVRQAQEENRFRAVTVVPRENLIERRPVAAAMVQMSPDMVRQVRLAPAQALQPTVNEVARIQQVRRQSAPASIVQPEVRNAPMVGGAPASQPSASAPQNPIGRSAQMPTPTAPAVAPVFTRQPMAPPPVAAPPGSTNPLARRERSDGQGGRDTAAQQAQQQMEQQRQQQERGARDAQQQQQRGQQEQQRQQQERAARDAQEQQRQQQDRAAREAQQQQQRGQQEQQRQQQERAARDAQQQQQRAQQEQQQKAAQEQQRQQQERAARDAQQLQQRQQQEQQKAAQEQQRQLQEQQRLQQEQQRQQQEQQRQQGVGRQRDRTPPPAAPAPAAPQPAQPAPQAQPQPQPQPAQRPERGKGDDKDKEKEKDKDKDKDKDENDRGRARGRDR